MAEVIQVKGKNHIWRWWHPRQMEPSESINEPDELICILLYKHHSVSFAVWREERRSASSASLITHNNAS